MDKVSPELGEKIRNLYVYLRASENAWDDAVKELTLTHEDRKTHEWRMGTVRFWKKEYYKTKQELRDCGIPLGYDKNEEGFQKTA